MTRLKPSNYFAIAIMIAMLVIIGQALTFRYFQSALLPLLFGGVVFLLAGLQLWRELTAKEKPKAKKEEPPPVVKGTSLGVLTLWMLGFSAAILLFGHLIAVPLFILSYVRWRGRGWGIAIAFATAVTAGLYGLFTLAMRVELYPGFIYQLITGRI